MQRNTLGPRLLSVLAAATMTTPFLLAAGCDGDAEDAAEEVGETIDEAADDVEDAIDD